MSAMTQPESLGWRMARYGISLVLVMQGSGYLLGDKPVLGIGMMLGSIYMLVFGLRQREHKSLRTHEKVALATGMTGIALILGSAVYVLFG
jgi:hypothetical protein